MRTSLIVVFLGCVACATPPPPPPPAASADTSAQVTGSVAQNLVREGAVLIDVRTREEFAAGHIEGAVNIPVEELRDRFDELPAGRATLVVYCRSGKRSAEAVRVLRASGRTRVYDLGPIAAWTQPRG